MQIVGMIEDKDSDKLAYEKTVELINSLPEIDGIFIAVGGAAGVAKAVKEVTKEKDIRIICYGLTPEIIKYIKEDVIDFSIDQDPYLQGYCQLKCLLNIFLKIEYPKKNTSKQKLILRLREIYISLYDDEKIYCSSNMKFNIIFT